jgi:galactokinase
VETALVGQRAENDWVGMRCGIMDQLICATGVAEHAVLIDCRSLERTPIPIPASLAVVLLDTGTRRELVDSAYNERRAKLPQPPSRSPRSGILTKRRSSAKQPASRRRSTVALAT